MIRQLGYVVSDIHAAMAHWTQTLGVGPFFYFPKVTVLDATYRGEAQPFEIAVSLANSGPTQIELMCELSTAPSTFGAPGLHHVALWTEQFDADLAKLGLPVVQSGAIGSRDNRFAYLASPTGTYLELSEVSGFKRRLFGHIAETCATWDGTNPVRGM